VIRRIVRSDRRYPVLLRAIHDPPAVVWLRGQGDTAVFDRPCVAVVGARACSAYGRSVARSLGRDLASAGVVVISGMARGIDGEAHRGALAAGGITVAVLGCGVDRDYPAGHAELARAIAEAGLLVSEYEPGVEPAPWRFPARNRVIAGLSRAVVVVEARERSGALLTVDFALEQGRDVLAVPGEITSALSAGSNALLRHGAAPVLAAHDVLDAVGVVFARSPRPVPGGDPGRVLDLLRDAPATVDEIARGLGLPVGATTSLLTRLELEGLVEADDGLFRASIA
jgi:DNA processing protein